ncbi:translational activator of GCN4, partial [Spiromyces aspiralis]
MNEIINGTNSPGRAAGDNDFNWAVFIQKTLLPALRCQKVNVRCEIIADEFIPKLKHYPISTSRGDSDAEAKSKAQEKAIVTGLVKVLYQVSGCYFADRKSRLSLLDALLAIGHQYPELFVEALGRLLIEDCDELIRVKSTASSERFRALKLVNCVLLVIHTRLLAGYSDGAASFASCSAIWEKLVYAQANLLYELATPTLTSLGKSALADTWRLLRGGKGSPGDAVLAVLERYLSYLLKSAPTGAGGPVYTVLLGSVISTANRLKSPPALAEQGRQFIAKHKPAILEFIRKNVLLAKVRPSNAVVTSLEDFLRDYLVNYDVDFKEALEPALKKAFLQTPETSLRALNFMAPLFGFGADRLFIEVVAEPLINSYTKSSNKVVKDDALELWSTLTRLCLLSDNTDGLRDVADKALIDPLVANKGGTPNNRVVMVQLVESLANLTERTGAASIVERLAELAGKEVNEPVQLAALRALSAHLPKLAAVNGGEIPEKVLDSIVKGLKLPEKSVKVRKAWVADVVGQFFMLTKGAEMPDEIAAALWSLVEKFEEKPLVHPAGPLEGYVAVAVGLKSLPPDSKYRRKLVQTITTFTPKPSFLLWDKVYHKVSDPEEISWELQALEAFFVHVLADGETKALPQEAESMFAEAFMWILTGPPSTNHKITEAVLSKLRSLICTDARRLSAVVLPVLFKHMDEHASPEQGGSASLARRWFGVLASLAQVSQTTATDSGELYTLLIELGLAAHHPAIIRFLHPKYSWVMLVQAAGANPGKLFEEYFGEIEARIFSALEQHSSPDSPRHQAALKWVEVMAFIGGTEAVMGFIDRVSEYLAPKALLDISAEEIAIYYTPEGTLYRDPLNRAKAVEDKNRRDYATEKWERELREDLARKNKLAQKGQVRKLTKEEQAAFDARKAIEDQARAKVKTIADRALRGLEVICANVRGNSEATSRCILQIVRLVVFGAVAKGRVGRLIGADAVSAAVSEIGGAAIGLGDPIFLRTVSIATLRVLGRGDDVPEEWRQEPIDDLLVRILFRVRMGSEVEPLTLSAFNYLFPLIQAVLDHDGFGKRYATTGRQAPQPTDEYAPVDKTSEQVIYCVDILAAHVPLARSEAGEAVLPRKEMIYALFKTMENRPQLIQSARSALIRLAEVMEPTLTTAAEREAFLSGLMSGDEMIRQATLEALDYVDLTDYSYSAPIWLAICGEMSANLAELGLDLWQENSMVVAPGLVEDLLTYLHMGNNSHVRQAAAFGIVQAVRELLGLPLRFASEAGSRRDEGREEEEEGPNSVAQSTVKLTPEVAALVKSLVAKLLQMYRDAYISLKPEYDEYGMVVPGTEDKRDPWETRESVAEVLRLLAPYLDSGETITSIMEFLVKSDDALGDRQDSVREHMLSAGIAMVRAQGSKYIMQLMPLLE